MALVKVPPQAAGLVRPFAFVFVLPEDLAGHDAIFVGFGLGFVWPYSSRRVARRDDVDRSAQAGKEVVPWRLRHY